MLALLGHLLANFGPALSQLSSPQSGQDAGLHLPLHLVRTRGGDFLKKINKYPHSQLTSETSPSSSCVGREGLVPPLWC